MQERDKEADRILKQIHKEHPKLAKPLWLLAKNLFFRAEHFPEDAVEQRRMALEEGMQWAEKCVALAPNDINCQLHLGVILARWSTNNGIIKSVFHGPAVDAAWSKAIKLKHITAFKCEHVLGSGPTMAWVFSIDWFPILGGLTSSLDFAEISIGP